MKTKVISIALNVILLVVLGIMGFERLTRALQDHYYAEFTGFVLRESAAQIEAGHSARVAEILKEIKGRPTYADLIVMQDRLRPNEAPSAKSAEPDSRDAPPP